MTGKEKPCKDCKYKSMLGSGPAGEATYFCDYIGIEGKRRPCPAGDGCTAFKPEKKRRRPDQKNSFPTVNKRGFFDT